MIDFQLEDKMIRVFFFVCDEFSHLGVFFSKKREENMKN
jgi:hypothetical protein